MLKKLVMKHTLPLWYFVAGTAGIHRSSAFQSLGASQRFPLHKQQQQPAPATRLQQSPRDADGIDDESRKMTSKPKSRRNREKQGGDSKSSSASRNKAISALSEPSSLNSSGEPSKKSPPSKDGNQENPKKNKWRRNQKYGNVKEGAELLPKAGIGFQENPRKRKSRRQQLQSKDRDISPLLPPPTYPDATKGERRKTSPRGQSSSSSSSGGNLLDTTAPTDNKGTPRTDKHHRRNQFPQSQTTSNGSSGSRSYVSKRKEGDRQQSVKSERVDDRLPRLADLFPPDINILKGESSSIDDDDDDWTRDDTTSPFPPPPSIDGVLPVSDLFFRPAKTTTAEALDVSDDEELPFSAEQSDQLATGNKIKVRRNQVKSTTKSSSKPFWAKRKQGGKRRMVRRGMEMLVGGVPINADPPLRYVDLVFAKPDEKRKQQWKGVVTLNSRDFGPMFHTSSVDLLSKTEEGLFCEHFLYNTMKWDVCPSDLQDVAADFDVLPKSNQTRDKLDSVTNDQPNDIEPKAQQAGSSTVPGTGEANLQKKALNETLETSSIVGWDKLLETGSMISRRDGLYLGGEIVFSFGVTREDLESGDSKTEVPILERVLAKGLSSCTEYDGFSVTFTKLVLTDLDDGTTMISGEFNLNLKDFELLSRAEVERRAAEIKTAVAQAMDDGAVQVAMAAAAQEETAWPQAVRDRIVEEFLFEDDGDELWGGLDDSDASIDTNANMEEEVLWLPRESKKDGYDGPFGMPGSVEYHKDDIFLGGGNDGVFWNYAGDSSSESPYGGKLGLRLVDAVVARAKERQPRVIAIGDVHGCIDELQDLLRQCDYRPGDLVVFLGDLVSKGPDSVSVVQMAREIGAIGVRGNHDFEVIRWHQAIKSGVDPPVVGSEHFHIATCLSKADMKWMYSLPWYISSKELSALFVHAGFVSGIRLAKQNPRLMMNMRSILPDGTVTSKFFNNWPWARLWDGPQTVLFGHDADRGLQQYEHAIGLDTGCVYGGRLTACILPEKRLVSVGARREYFKYRRKHYD